MRTKRAIAGMYMYLSAAACLPTWIMPMTGRSVTTKKAHAAGKAAFPFLKA